MSGIVGLFDPDGADPSLLRSAAAAAPLGGLAEIRSIGPLLVGTLAREGESHSSVETQVSILVADARVDAALPGTAAARLAEGKEGLALLAAVLDEAGPEGLDGLAADFAFARWDSNRGELLLSRDAFGIRPLFWAQRDARIGFASDPAVLIALGLASGDLDHGVVTTRLFGRDPAGERTVFAGVYRVPGGRWIAFDPSLRMRRGRWFRPERVLVESSSLEEAASRVRDAVVAAVAAREQGERTAISLSGGRDSAAVAVAAQIAGIRATCLTFQHDPDSVPSEQLEARSLAEKLGHAWRSVHVGTEVALRDLESLPDLAGSPLGFPAFPAAMAARDAVVGAEATVVLDGEGGDPLFAAHPVAVLDLARSGRFFAAMSVAKAYRHGWIYSYGVIAKTALRALAPRPLLDLRERTRRPRPWVVGPAPTADLLTAPRSSRELLIRFLLYLGGSDYLELSTQLWQRVGIRYACPLYDQRVVRAALALTPELRVPVPGPKPVLAAALLGDVDKSRVKANFMPYAVGLDRALHRDFPWLFDSGSLCTRYGFVHGSGLKASADRRWLGEGLALVPLEMWLRRLEVG